MGSEVLGSGAKAPEPMQVPAPAACSWAMAAARAAARVPASHAEADAWIVRGWADVAVGCLALDCPAPGGHPRELSAFSGLDEVVRGQPIASAGENAGRLRRLRRLAGPVPAWYPDAHPVSGPIRRVRGIAWRAARLLSWFGELLLATAATLPCAPPSPLISASQLAWGARYRPSPADTHVTVCLPVSRRLARRTWMCLPGLPGPGTVVAEVPSTATAMEQQIWRGIHEGAHLDHLAALARLGAHGPPWAPRPEEFGDGLLIAEAYAMAVELLAAVECVLAGEGHAVRQLGVGLIERATRLPGGARPAAEFTDLPTLAEVYLLGPLEVLAGGAAADALPRDIVGSLHDRWRAACAAYPPAATFGSAAASLIGQSA